MGLVIEHVIILRGGVCDHTHEKGHKRGVVDKGKQEGRVDGEKGHGARGGYNSARGRLHALLAELDGASMANSGHPQRMVRNPRKIGS